ncbi:MAG TPA: hypothetical protein VF099_11270 [Ktedonobacterales bacterium]
MATPRRSAGILPAHRSGEEPSPFSGTAALVAPASCRLGLADGNGPQRAGLCASAPSGRQDAGATRDMPDGRCALRLGIERRP